MSSLDGQLPVVVFSNGQSTHLALNAGQHVAFNEHLLNIGANVDPNGVFTCVQPGLYAFHFYSLAKLGQEMWLDIYKNNMSVGTAYGYTTGSYGDAGNSVILTLVAGDTVYIRVHDRYTNALYGADHEIYTTFTGVLLDSGMFGKTF